MEIPIGADVYCIEGRCGRSACIILDPVKDRITHVVVEEDDLIPSRRLVPIHMVQAASAQRITLRCTRGELSELETFTETGVFPMGIGASGSAQWPYIMPEFPIQALEHEKLPPGEVAIRRGSSVRAKDGDVGRVDEFLVNPQDGKITHLVLREGHFWNYKDVSIPVLQIERIAEDGVHLKLDKKAVEALPPIHPR